MSISLSMVIPSNGVIQQNMFVQYLSTHVKLIR
jgi:hypothetical protein